MITFLSSEVVSVGTGFNCHKSVTHTYTACYQNHHRYGAYSITIYDKSTTVHSVWWGRNVTNSPATYFGLALVFIVRLS